MALSGSFEPVLEAARHGGEWAWARIVHDIDPTLRAYVRRQGGIDVDDITGETWLHIARGLPRFTGDETAFRSWVFMVAHHRIIDERRKFSRRLEDPSRDLDSEAREIAPSAETIALERHASAQLRSVLDQLPPSQREAVLLRFLAGFGVNEIAHITGRRPGAVSALLRRALRRLEKILKESRTFSP